MADHLQPTSPPPPEIPSETSAASGGPIVGRATTRMMVVAGILLALCLLAACGSTPAPVQPPTLAPTTVVQATQPAATSPPTQTATQAPTEPPPPTPTATLPPTDEPPPTLQSVEPLTIELKATVVASLPATPTPESGGAATWGDIAILPLEPTAGGPPLWAAYSVGMDFYAPEAGHFVAIYTFEDGAWQEIDRLVLDGCAQYVDESSLVQVPVEPERIWLEMQSYAGVHSGCYDLLSVGQAAGGPGQDLRREASGFSANPGAGNVVDLDGDGVLEVVLNETEYYVFCYACGVEWPSQRIQRWDGTQMADASLQTLPQGAPPELREANNRAVALAGGGLWKDAQVIMANAAAYDIEDPSWQEIVTWNAILIDMMASSRAEAAQSSAYPLLGHLFYGDYDAVLDLMRAYSPEEIWDPHGPLIADTVAEGWETALSDWVVQSTGLALEVDPTLAAAHFMTGWGVLLADDADPLVVEDVARAAELEPGEGLYAENLAYLQGGPPEEPTAPPPEPTATTPPQPTATQEPQPLATSTPEATQAEPWDVRSLLVGPGSPGRLYALIAEQYSGLQPTELARFLVSDDQGQTWQPFAGGLPPGGCLRNINMDYAVQEALYASTCQGIYRWTGGEWQLFSPQETSLVAITYGQPERIWALGPFASSTGVIRSDNGGANWEQAGNGLVSFNGVANLGIDPTDANSLYAIIWPKYAGSYLRRGTYPGQWQTMPTPMNNSQIDTGMTIDGGTGALYVTARDWTSEHWQLWRTLDPKVPNVEQVQWELVHDFGSDEWVTLLASGAGPDGLVLYVRKWVDPGDGGLWQPEVLRSPDGGQSWETLPLPLGAPQE